MKEEPTKQDKLLEATDYLEAVSTLKAMKNLFFFIIIISLLATQTCFWLTRLGFVRLDSEEKGKPASQLTSSPQSAVSLAVETDKVKVEKSETTEKIEKAAKIITGGKAAADANTAGQKQKKEPFRLMLKAGHVELFVRICNFILIFSAFVYFLTVLVAMKVSLIGRLGGVNHITKAVFLSIFAIAFLLPWQALFNGVIVGAIYTPDELFNCLAKCDGTSIAQKTCMYLRFCGLWVLTVLLFLSAQIRTIRWARTMLRRLGIIA